MRANRIVAFVVLGVLFAAVGHGHTQALPVTARLKDIARVQGVRSNQLFGVGIVVGLDRTGDSQQSKFTPRAIASMLQQMGMTIDAAQIRTENVATVMVTAGLEAFKKPGDTIDATVSSIGNAESLQGGFLVQTPLQGADGEVYAVAQGPISIGGYNATGGGGGGGAAVQKNHPTVGRVPNGAIVEREVEMDLAEGQCLTMTLHNPDFTTASKAAAAISAQLAPLQAVAVDASSVQVSLPRGAEFQIVDLIARIENLEVETDSAAKIIINEKTGTIVMGGDVRVKPGAVAHANLNVTVTTTPVISQPPPLSSGMTVATGKTEVSVKEGTGRVVPLDGGSSIDDVVASLNAIGATPRDMMAILQAMKSAGLILAEIEMQ